MLLRLSRRSVSSELFQAHHEQNARRGISRLERDHKLTKIDRSELARGVLIYYLNRGTKCGKWGTGYVRRVDDQFITASTSADHRGKPIKTEHEDIRVQSTVSLLNELDAMDFHTLLLILSLKRIWNFRNMVLRHRFPSSWKQPLPMPMYAIEHHRYIPVFNMRITGYPVFLILCTQNRMGLSTSSSPILT